MHDTPSEPNTTSDPSALRVFLCHAHEDKATVRDLYHRLRAEGVEPWLDEEDLLPGQHWEGEIETAVENTDAETLGRVLVPRETPPPPTPPALPALLDHLLDTHQHLQLPDGSLVTLERVYVSLKADRMNADERKAEHDFYLDDVAALLDITGSDVADRYTHFAAMRRVIVCRPRMHMLTARSWQQLFSSPEERRLSLAEIIQYMVKPNPPHCSRNGYRHA